MMTDDTCSITARQFRNLQKRVSSMFTLTMDLFYLLPDGWSKYPIDPLPVEDGLKHLRLKDGIVLRAYQFKSGGNGNGFVYALPVDAEFPDPTESLVTKSVVNGIEFEAPSPSDALSCFMLAFDGDRSPRSFFEASVLVRELEELGAMWHGSDWRTHTVIDADPFALCGKTGRRACKEISSPADEWTWASEKPADWRPEIEMRTKATLVRFYSYSGLGHEAVYVNSDKYSRENYVPQSSICEIAHGPGGYIF